MTPDQIKAMSDEELDSAISWRLSAVLSAPHYSTDLNTAWPLQYDEFSHLEWDLALREFGNEPRSDYPSDPRRVPRKLETRIAMENEHGRY